MDAHDLFELVGWFPGERGDSRVVNRQNGDGLAAVDGGGKLGLG